MKCPKCHYLSFDPEPRCRNCGYTLALGDEVDLAIRPDAEPEASPVDLSLRPNSDPFQLDPPAESSPALDALTSRPPAAKRRRRAAAARGPFDGPEPASALPTDDDDQLLDAPSREERWAALDSMSPPEPVAQVEEAQAPPAAPTPKIARPAPIAPATAELPLFVKAMAAPAAEDAQEPVSADEPLVKLHTEVRPPLVVRKSAPDTGTRHAAEASRKLGPLDRDLLEDLERIETNERIEADAEARAARRGERAGAGLRLGAAVVDGLLVTVLLSAVVWTTLRWCDLTLQQIRILPPAPTIAFLLLVGFGYLLIFTAAGGQTLGKMLFGLRVTRDTADGTEGGMLSLGQALYRELLALPSILALGLGFLPGLFGDRRALHDRLSHTQVVRA